MDNKAWYASRTIWGVILSIAGKAVAAIFGYEITETDTAQLTDIVVAVVGGVASFVGDLLAWYGRIKATKKIGK
jgi:hypothetical protein